MPHFQIFEGPSAQATRAMKLELENKRLKEENARLRAKCGEAAVAEVSATLAAERLGEPQEIGAIMGGQGHFTIGAARKGGAVAMNPLVARARAGKLPAAAAARALPAAPRQQAQDASAPLTTTWQPDDLPASTQPQDLQQGQDQDGDASQRFSLMELGPAPHR